MRETIGDYPALQMEDDGFLLSLKSDFATQREKLFGTTDGEAFPVAITRLVNANSTVRDKGSQLPLYVPIFSDDGALVGSRAVPVWSGTCIDFPLYPGLANDRIDRFLYGNSLFRFEPSAELLECDPAFRLALLVHFALENVVMHELEIEAFLLGVYGEIFPDDERYSNAGIPSTRLVDIRSSTSLRAKRSKTSEGYCIALGEAKTDGWRIRIRGTKPKERVFRDAWQESRGRVSAAGKAQFSIDGEEYALAKAGQDGRKRERSGSADVDFMIAWIDALKDSEGLPKRGKRFDWVEIHRRFEHENISYTNSWTADTMRRTYTRRKTKGAKA